MKTENQIGIPSTSRAYSPIMEERDSRPASVDPTEKKSLIKGNDNMSLPSRAVTPSSMPSRAVSPNIEPQPNVSNLPSSESILPSGETSTEANADVNNANIQPRETNKSDGNTDAKSASESEEKLQPIFKPLITEKGKSKTTGKSIGGWI